MGLLKFIRNVLAVLGLAVLVGGGYLSFKLLPIVTEFDPDAVKTYTDFATKLLETKDPGQAMMWVVPVEDDSLTPEEVKDSLVSLANARNFLFVGESRFSKAVEEKTGKSYRYISFMSFCDALVGKMMADYRDAYTGFMPCRIAVVEDKHGKLLLYSMNLDMLIHGGRMLPPELRKEATRVRNIVREIMEGVRPRVNSSGPCG